MAKKGSQNQPMLLGFDAIESQAPNSTPPHSPLPSNASVPTTAPSSQLHSSSEVVAKPVVAESVVAESLVDESTAEPARSSHDFPREGDIVVLVDSHSLIYQVFHALPSMTNPHGQEVGAVQGFLRDIANLRQQWKPEFLVCAFDASEITFRNELYDQYKAHRESMPDALRDQIGMIHRCLETLAIPMISLPGYEADDILATLAKQASDRGARVLLVTSDKDCRQLLNDRVQMLNVRKNELFGAPELMATWGIRPEQVVDFQSLVGDSVDNVPGVPMIGPKAAQQLLEQFGDLDSILANVDQVAGEKKKENLRTHRDKALLSRELVRLKVDCELPLQWSQMRPGRFDRDTATQLFQDLGMRRIAEVYLAHSTESPTTTEPTASLSWEGYRTVDTVEALASLLKQIGKSSIVSVDTETTSTRARDAELVGISLCWGAGQAAYIPILGPAGETIIRLEDARTLLAPWFADPSRAFLGQNIKYDAVVLRSHGLPIANVVFDTMVADYLLDAGGRNHDLDELAKRWLGHVNIPITELIGTGKNQITMDQVPVEKVSRYACEDVDVPYRLYEPMKERLKNESLSSVMDRLELPLIQVLAGMEYEGIRISTERLRELSSTFEVRLLQLFDEIMQIAGESFNPDSPKQLAGILFERLQLRVVKRTKTGPSTDAEVLEELAAEHPLPAKILEYRQFTKLKNTYVDALPKLVSARTGRLHTSFRQDIAATGRLSSVEPNLQNIPVRTAEGRSIRSAFLAREEGWSLVAADYSQIELRVLAHFSQDASMTNAFVEDEDIHARVASEVHGIPIDQVTSEMRRSAKAVNFGILYGQSAFGLAKSLGIARGDASDFIDRYFDRYPSVRGFISDTLVQCRRDGYVTTMSGRKRYLKGLRDFPSLPDVKKKQLLEPERMAINTVIQGSAADMIKMAMIEIHRELQHRDWPAKMILQIHDELIFDCRDDYREELARLVQTTMTTVMPLRVPLKVDVKIGRNWADCEPV
ncbi:DNA polymerase I [Pirellulaceae bacterium SH467]